MGTYQRRLAHYSVPYPDLSEQELREWVRGLREGDKVLYVVGTVGVRIATVTRREAKKYIDIDKGAGRIYFDDLPGLIPDPEWEYMQGQGHRIRPLTAEGRLALTANRALDRRLALMRQKYGDVEHWDTVPRSALFDPKRIAEWEAKSKAASAAEERRFKIAELRMQLAPAAALLGEEWLAGVVAEAYPG